jgi:hypothetical protein
VGSALNYWLAMVGVTGFWIIVDGDSVEVSNLNRQMLFLADDSEYTGAPRPKAELAAARLGAPAVGYSGWYDAEPQAMDGSYDVILPLANERGVRAALQARLPPLLLHATTSRQWQAQLHRHVPGRDDCLNCRLPGELAQTECSTGEVRAGEPDAALPFLSATAGLLLAAQLARLSHLGESPERENFTAFDMSKPMPVDQRLSFSCRAGCHGWASPAVRRAAATGTRFASLDSAASS